MNPLPFHVLLYRYFFISWMFRDIQGDMFQRAAAARHNQRQAAWLPTYMRRWAVMAALLAGLGVVAEDLQWTTAGLVLHIGGGACFSALVAVATVWFGLRHGRARRERYLR